MLRPLSRAPACPACVVLKIMCIGGWGSEGASTPQPGDRFRFRSCVRAGGRADGRQISGCEVEFSRKIRAPVTFPFSLFGPGAFPFSPGEVPVGFLLVLGEF